MAIFISIFILPQNCGKIFANFFLATKAVFMKNNSIFKKPLMISQEEIAMLLGISRSQWSMYVLGQRHLSTEDTLKWAALLSNFHDICNATSEESTLEQ